jgi:hypothetical protein
MQADIVEQVIVETIPRFLVSLAANVCAPPFQKAKAAADDELCAADSNLAGRGQS